MGKGVANLHQPIRQMCFHRLPSSGGIDRHQPKTKGLPNRQTGSAEFPLDEDKVTGPGNPRQPGEDRGKALALEDYT